MYGARYSVVYLVSRWDLKCHFSEYYYSGLKTSGAWFFTARLNPTTNTPIPDCPVSCCCCFFSPWLQNTVMKFPRPGRLGGIHFKPQYTRNWPYHFIPNGCKDRFMLALVFNLSSFLLFVNVFLLCIISKFSPDCKKYLHQEKTTRCWPNPFPRSWTLPSPKLNKLWPCDLIFGGGCMVRSGHPGRSRAPYSSLLRIWWVMSSDGQVLWIRRWYQVLLIAGDLVYLFTFKTYLAPRVTWLE